MIKKTILAAATASLVCAATVTGAAEPTAKDIMLASLAAPAGVAAPAAAPGGAAIPVANYDAMAVAVLVENPDGTLSPHNANNVLRTGQRFRVKVLSPRDGDVTFFNTNPRGVTKAVATMPVRAGIEVVTEVFMLTAESGGGEEQLHVALQPHGVPAPVLQPQMQPVLLTTSASQPAAPTGIFAWFSSMFGGNKVTAGASKDIRLVTENAPQATYMNNAAGQGGYVTLRIRHQ